MSIPAQESSTLANFIWKNAEDLWGDFPHTDFGKIILPFTVLRRLECVLEPNKEAVLTAYNQYKDKGLMLDEILKTTSGTPFYNTSSYHLGNLGGTQTRANLEDYLTFFSENVRQIFEKFDFYTVIKKLDEANLLLKICQNFASTDLHPNAVSDRTMSNVYEHLIAKFGSEVGTGAEDFMTPRDIVHLSATLLLAPDDDLFAGEKGLIRTLYDQTCGTAGFLTDMMNYVAGYAEQGKIAPTFIPFGQELQPETYAVAVGSMLLKGSAERDLSANIKLGSTLSDDQFMGRRFHYQCSNPPFGKKWEKDAKAVQAEHDSKKGRFNAGLPSIDDGAMLFLQNLIAKLELPENGGGRGAIVLSGSPLFNGEAASGPSEIRRFILENDYLEAIVALPTNIFFRTGIGTYVWLISNRKPTHRKNKVQLIDASNMASSMRKNEGKKSKYISQENIDQITRIYADFAETPISKIFDYQEFGYRRIKTIRPLRYVMTIDETKIAQFTENKDFKKLNDEQQTLFINHLNTLSGSLKYSEFVQKVLEKSPLAKLSKALKKSLIAHFGEKDENGEIVVIDFEPQYDNDLSDYERVPLTESVQDYFAREVLPHAPDAQIDPKETDEQDGKLGKVGYEINFNRYFYQFEQPRHPSEVLAEIQTLSAKVSAMLAEFGK
ncbi:type I restriction-modification system subunit M [Pasteurella bettyae]